MALLSPGHGPLGQMSTETIKLGRQEGLGEHMMGGAHGPPYSLSCYQLLDQIRETYANYFFKHTRIIFFFLGVINPARVSFHFSFKNT